jgi:hypothetical protein
MRVEITEAPIGEEIGGALIVGPDRKTVVFDPDTPSKQRCALLAEFLTDDEFAQLVPAVA